MFNYFEISKKKCLEYMKFLCGGCLSGRCFVRSSFSLSQTGSTLVRTFLSPFARCTLGLNRHFYTKNILCDHC